MAVVRNPCANCGSTAFASERCVRCGRPVLLDAEYADRVEMLAWTVVNAGYDEYGDLRSTPGSGSGLRRAIVDLANALRQYHYEGDGCEVDHD